MVERNMKKRRSPKTMSEALDFLLYDLCVDLGFCLPPLDHAWICASEYWEADAFTQEVFRVEGMDPDEYLTLTRQVRERFTDVFGSVADPETFQQRQQCASGDAGCRLPVSPCSAARRA